MRSNGISVISNRRHISLPVEDILYIPVSYTHLTLPTKLEV